MTYYLLAGPCHRVSYSQGADNYLTIRASLAHRDTLFFYTIFTQGQMVKYTNPNYHKTIQKLQELEEIAR